jgi:MoaA/NifB/PqqE/SkfB family radical SAM enzyme
MARLPICSVNLGTGENSMHPDFLPILNFLRAQPIKLTITSNGHSIAILDDEHVRAFHDVEFSLDYPTTFLPPSVDAPTLTNASAVETGWPCS